MNNFEKGNLEQWMKMDRERRKLLRRLMRKADRTGKPLRIKPYTAVVGKYRSEGT